MQLTNLPIKSIRIGRDSLTNTSRGVCYVEMNSVVDAMFLHNQLLGEPPTIDEKIVSVSYFRPASIQPQFSNSNKDSGGGQPTAAANAALAAAQWSHQGRQGIANQYGHDDIERMAEYSASLYAKTASEKAHYLEYYRNYYKNGGKADENMPVQSDTKVEKSTTSDKVTVNGIEYPIFPTPDVSTYTYDEASGYYYDASTQLYYDSNSQYYFDAKTNKYVYWSPEHKTFLPAPEEQKNEQEKTKQEDKKDKVKTAKRIAKDMEKWAKTLNQKKQQQQPVQPQQPQQVPSGSLENTTEDVAFSILHNKQQENDSSLAKLTGYGSEDELGGPSEDNISSGLEEQQFTDWTKLACLLCKRQFPSREKLTK